MSIKHSNSKQIELLSLCLEKIEEKLEWPDSSEWRNSHFELLSERIFEDTQIQLSPMTLKRIWGKVSYHSFPAMHTLDVLAKFIAYENWIYFQQDIERKAQQKLLDSQSSRGIFPKPVQKNIAFVAVIISFLVLLTQFASIKGAAVLSLKDGMIRFDFEPVSQGLPNTVVFNYEVKNTQADSVFIQQSWDPNLREKVDKEGNVHTATYYYPGFYKAKLLLNKEVVSEKDLYIKSKGWLGTIDKEPIPFYLDQREISAPGIIRTRATQLTQRGYDLHESLPTSSLHLVKDFGDISGENFKLTTQFKHTLGQGAAICQKSSLVILCSETPFIIPFSIPGCVGELDLYLAGQNYSGKKNDLTGFGVSFTDWMKLEVDVNDKALKIKVNEQAIFKDTLKRNPGKIVGVRYKFHGTGAVNSLKIESPGQAPFEDTFGK